MLILLGSLLHWKNQLSVGGMPVDSQMSRSKSQQFSQLSIVLGLQEKCELLQEVETTMNKERVCVSGCLPLFEDQFKTFFKTF